MKKRSCFLLLAVFLAVIFINMIAWKSTAFCDFYVENVFPIWVNIFGRLNGFWSFSVGEIMLAIGLIWIAVAVVLGIVAGIFYVIEKCIAKRSFFKYKAFFRYFYKGTAWCAVLLFAVMTLNCFILYHCSTFDQKYMIASDDEYTAEELMVLRNYIVQKANVLSKLVERDEDGNVIYTQDINAEAIACMQRMGEEYKQLEGYYPQPKQIATSEFLSQQYMKGYYFPFSMEANYNSKMYLANWPATICHELAHVKGFIYEDEANLIGFLACIQSDDPFFQYSGYLSVLNYIDNDFYETINRDRRFYNSQEKISAQVKRDNVFLTEESWNHVEAKAVISTKTVKKLSEEFIETNLVVNGIPDGSLSYGRVVGLMLEYYDSNIEGYLQKEYLVQGE